jgi:hypothetical protein
MSDMISDVPNTEDAENRSRWLGWMSWKCHGCRKSE